jgi:PrtD family type I secretion system ABC transporter
VNSRAGFPSFFRQAKAPLLTLMLLSLIVNIGALIQPFFFLNMSLNVISTRDATVLYYLIGILVFVYGCIFVLDFVRYRILNSLVFLLQESVAGLVHRAMLHHTEVNPGVVLVQPIGFLTLLRSFLASGGVVGFLDLPFLPLYLLAVFLLEPLFFFYALIAVGLVTLLTFLDHSLTEKVLKQHGEHNALSLKALNGQMFASDPILVMGMKQPLYQHWLDALWQGNHFYDLHSMIYSKISVLSKMIRHIMPIGVMGVGAYLSLHPSVIGAPVSIFVVMTASILISRIVSIADGVLTSWKSFVAARDAFKGLSALLQPYQQPDAHKITLSRPIEQLVLDSASYISPRTGITLVNNASFSAESGQVWAIMGGIGSGKSTLARLLLTIFPLSRGNLRYNDIDAKSVNMQALGSSIGYLPQEIELFTGTIAQNIARFNEPINHEAVIEAGEFAGVSRWVNALPLGYDTIVGNEDVHIISGGQRQQIALARAYYHRPSLLVLDEPNANLDEQGEQRLNQALLFFKSIGTLVFVITHRPAVLIATDHLLIMNQGLVSYAGPRPISEAQVS